MKSGFIYFPMLNSSTNKIRVCDDTMRKIKAGDLEKIQMMYRPIPLYSPKVMVSGGVSWNGVSELKFFIGHADTFSYLQCLELYKADLIRLKEPDRVLLFQQDNAKPHTSKKRISFLMKIQIILMYCHGLHIHLILAQLNFYGQ